MKLKKLAAMLLTLCLIIAMAPLAVFAAPEDDETIERGRELYILGRKIDTNGTISSDTVPHEGTIRYDQVTKTLTLHDAKLDLANYYMPPEVNNNYVAGICAWDDLNIVLLGNNYIYSSRQGNDFGSTKKYVYGIKNSSGNINILGDNAAGYLDISLENGTGNSLFGIGANRDFSVKGSNVSLAVMVEKKAAGETNGIDLFGDFAIDDGANVLVTADGADAVAVDGTGLFEESYVGGGATLTMVATYGTAFRCYLPSASLTETGAKVWRTGWPELEYKDWPSQSDLLLNSYQYVSFAGSRAPAERANSVYVLGRKVSEKGAVSKNKVPYTGDRMEYDPASNTLTLTNAVLDLKDYKAPVSGGNLIAAIYGTSDLAIVLEGESKIIFTGEKYDKDTEYAYGIESWGKVDFSGSGTLNIALADDIAQGSNPNTRIYGIGSDDEVNVDKAAISINMGDGGKATGMYLWGPVNLTSGATVIVTSKGDSNIAVNGVNDMAKSTVSTDSLFEMTSDYIAFNCWSAGAGLKEAGALVNTSPTPDGAVVWDRSTWLNEYKYVRFPEYDPDVITIKDDNTLSVKGKTAAVRHSDLKKKNRNLAVSKVISFKNKGQGTKTYAKVSGSKKILVSKKTGKVTVKKGLKKGTYKVKVKVRAAGNKTHNAAAKTVTFRIIVK